MHYLPIPETIAREARETRVDRFGHRLEPSCAVAPCRVCLRIGAQPEELVLLSYQPLPDTGPYAEVGPIFIHAAPCEPYRENEAFPADFQARRLVLRAYDDDGRIAAALVAEPGTAPGRAAELFGDPRVTGDPRAPRNLQLLRLQDRAFVMTESQRIRDVCRYVDAHPEERLTLEVLARLAKMSKYHFARRFKAIAGVTPREYIAGARLRRLKDELKVSPSVDDAVYGAGYGSASRVYEGASRSLGMTPAQYRRFGQGVAISYAALETPLGTMLIGATDRGICFAQFGESEAELRERLRAEYPRAEVAPMRAPYHPDFARWVEAIRAYLAAEGRDLDLPLDVGATAFQMRVWKYLQSIPYGHVQSYGEVAAGIGRPSAARAVAGAVGRNAVALVIPCHRVIRESGALGGYRWGLERKRTLLDLERAGRR